MTSLLYVTDTIRDPDAMPTWAELEEVLRKFEFEKNSESKLRKYRPFVLYHL